MAKIELFFTKLLKWEGGYVNHKNDKGGVTNKGITIGTYRYYRILKELPQPSVEDLKNITQKEWMDVLKTFYWDKWKADQIANQSIANFLVDWHWTSGVYGIKYPQQVLGVISDGIVGNKTLATVNQYPDQQELFQKLWDRRKLHFENIVKGDASQEDFIDGWMNRLNDYKFEP